jgi:hypothetical protein
LCSAGIAAIIRVPFIHVLAISNDFFFATVYVTIPNLAYHQLTLGESDVAIWSTVEPGLGIIATAACVLRPLMMRCYDLSIDGTNRIRDTNTHHSTWHNERIAPIRSKTFPDDMKSYDTGNDGMEIERVVTSVLGNYKSEKGRERSWRNPGSMQKSRVGNKSEEELTVEGKGIMVHKTVEIRTHEVILGQSKAETTNSGDSDN